jgi:hypothetical protein
MKARVCDSSGWPADRSTSYTLWDVEEPSLLEALFCALFRSAAQAEHSASLLVASPQAHLRCNTPRRGGNENVADGLFWRRREVNFAIPYLVFRQVSPDRDRLFLLAVVHRIKFWNRISV